MKKRPVTQVVADLSAVPLTPDQLLAYENVKASEVMPQHLIDSMSERQVYLSRVNEAEELNLKELANSLEKTGSFRLPANTFLGQLGRDGQAQASASSKGTTTEAVRRPFRPAWQDNIYHPKIATIPSRSVVKGRDAGRIKLHTLYPPENRTPFRPQGYPWTCVGRIEVFQNGARRAVGTATLVGRRIVITSGHLMPRDGSPGRWGIHFVPGYFDGSSTVGLASWTEAYRAITISPGEETQDRDISILKLYNPLGDALGWMGMRTYNDDWEDQSVWALVGYPDITGGERPTFQTGIAVIDDDPSGDFMEIEHRGDASDGNSGGPLWSQWPDGPYLVGVHSGSEYKQVGPIIAEDNNVAAGGSGMVKLAVELEAQWP
ncbi:trypsin-like serine peptidase [Ensifer adhaerens]|uniref:trypsin-like serine peptidase n=1 Tax=Ensifer adhaerens TaxID=106592 RepID=UPI003D07B093